MIKCIKPLVLGISLLLGCSVFALQPTDALSGYLSQELNKQLPDSGVLMANPASTYCISEGGQLQIQLDEGGNQYGVCKLPNQKSYEEWCFYRKQQGLVDGCPNLANEGSHQLKKN